MTITLTPITIDYFPLLLKWLTTNHVQAWWDSDIKWTLEKIEEKYFPYTQGYKIADNQKKLMHAYIIEVNKVPVGYFQFYNAYDFERTPALHNLPQSLGSFDIFIGETDYLNKGIGTQALLLGFSLFYNTFEYLLVDVDKNNQSAQRLYEKVGFKVIQTNKATNNIRMIKQNL